MSVASLVLTSAVVTAASTFGVIAGVGGAVLMVPLLLLLGLEPPLAASVGLLATAVASTAAAPRQLSQRLANHRLAVVLELGAVTGAVAGAVGAAHLSSEQFRLLLAAAVLLAAVSAASRKGLRNLPDATLGPSDVGEQVGALAGAYDLDGAVVPYHARRIHVGVAGAALIGVVAGTTGTSGGYLKTPLMSEVMHVPTRVAAATTTFASGITAASALLVYVGRGVVPAEFGTAAILAALVGGAAGAQMQSHITPQRGRRVLATLLTLIAGLLLWPR